MGKKIPVSSLINEFKIMRDAHWSYQLGAAKKGLVDCSGAFTYVWNKYDLSIDHGSNSIIRKFVVGDLIPICDAKPGMAVFKIKPWTDSSADLSNRWNGTEPGNSFHMGLAVQNGSKMSVIHAKGVNYGVVDTPLDGTWTFAAKLKNVDYGEMEENTMATFTPNASVSVTSGRLNVRVGPAITTKVVAKLEDDERIEILDKVGNWFEVRIESGIIGYVNASYVIQDHEETTVPETTAPIVAPSTMLVIEDSEGNVFYPNGEIKISIKPYSAD